MICLTQAYDDEGFFGSPNSWGTGFPSLRLRYEVFLELFHRGDAYGWTLSDVVTGTEVSLPVDPESEPPTPPPMFTCWRDGRVFRTKKRLRRHKWRRHGIVG